MLASILFLMKSEGIRSDILWVPYQEELETVQFFRFLETLRTSQ